MSTTIVTRTLSPLAVEREINRRKKPRATRKPSRSWVFRGMGNADLAALANGEPVRVEFKSGRVETVGLRR
jgi:hypothetical protein